MPLYWAPGLAYGALVGHADGRRGRLCFVAFLALGLLAAPLPGHAQRRTKLWRVGVLSGGSLSPHLLAAFRQGLRELQYVEGQTITIEVRPAGEKLDRLPELAAELIRLPVDVIVTSGAPAALAAKRATSTIPIVMAQINDPVGLGLVASLAQPGGNITGLANLHSELAAKHLELIKETVPKASRVAVLWNPLNPGAARLVDHSQHAARVLGMTLVPVEVRDPQEFERAFARMSRERAHALLLPPDPFFLPHGQQIVALAERRRLPSVYGWRELVEAGGLMAYGPNIPDMFRRAAVYVDKILKGTRPADLPVEQPMRFDMVVNLRTAKALGLAIPQSVLIRADQIIQ